MRFAKGHIPWNKGKKDCFSEETIQLISIRTKEGLIEKGYTSEVISELTKKGMDNDEVRAKLKNRIMTEKLKLLISEKTKEAMNTPEMIEKISGENNSNWKGGTVDFWHIQAWENFGKKMCEGCGCSNNEYEKLYEEHLHMHNNLIPRDYTVMDPRVWICVCNPCHRKLESKIIKELYIKNKEEMEELRPIKQIIELFNETVNKSSKEKKNILTLENLIKRRY